MLGAAAAGPGARPPPRLGQAQSGRPTGRRRRSAFGRALPPARAALAPGRPAVPATPTRVTRATLPAVA
eukprot:4520061-Lingulodinium_polyedra.AAC.1